MRYIPEYERIPYGLTQFQKGFRIRFPLLTWHRRGYDIFGDSFVRGWWRFDVMIRLERFSLTFRCGWTLP